MVYFFKNSLQVVGLVKFVVLNLKKKKEMKRGNDGNLGDAKIATNVCTIKSFYSDTLYQNNFLS